jgi:hypothetical protein
MGIFDFFKRKAPEREKITYEELKNWILDKNQEMAKNNELIINQISDILSKFDFVRNQDTPSFLIEDYDDYKDYQ